ncbi:MAG: BatA domain-containing protein [Planctomycetota bacterium]|nr:BatA domain-containing protein [Planctomycetota bacterium]
MVGISFVHPAILGGLALGSLPIIIHILNRRRFKQMDWAAMEFLLQAAVRNRRRIRLENLLLLLLRVLVVCLLVLAVTRPFSKKSAFASLLGAGGTTERIILLDDSHSMRAGQGNRTSLAKAKSLIKAMVTRLHNEKSSDRVTIILGSTPRTVDDRFNRVAVAGAHYERMLDRIGRLRVSDGTLDVVTALDAMAASVEEEDRRIVLYIASDFRRKDWTTPDGSVQPHILEALRRYSDRVKVHFLDVGVGSESVQNVGITNLETRERAVIAGVPTTFVATVKNHGPSPVSNVTVTFRFPKRTLQRKLDTVLVPGESMQVQKEFTFRTAGPVTVSAAITTDQLPGDDIRRLVVRVRRSMRFLLVNGEPSPEPYRGEIDHLAAALAPPSPTPSGIEVDEVVDSEFSGRELDPYDGVFLCNVYRLTDERIKRLEEFVRKGGGLVFFLGDQVDPQVYNASFFGRGEKAGQGLLPLLLLDVEGSTDDYVNFAPPALDHPIIRFLRGINEIVLRTVSFRRFVRAEPPLSNSTATVLMSYTDQDSSPAIAEKGFGEGRVLLFTSAADTEWSDFPISPVFLAILQETARYVVKPDLADATLPVSAPVDIVFDATRMRRRATISPPEEQGGGRIELTLTEDTETGKQHFRYGRTQQAGIYTVHLESPENQAFDEPFAFNIDPTEGDLRRVPSVKSIADAVPGAIVENTQDGALFDLEESDRSEFWRTLIFLLVGAAVLETLLAWRFGHHKTKVVATEGKQVFVR